MTTRSGYTLVNKLGNPDRHPDWYCIFDLSGVEGGFFLAEFLCLQTHTIVKCRVWCRYQASRCWLLLHVFACCGGPGVLKVLNARKRQFHVMKALWLWKVTMILPTAEPTTHC